MAYQLRYWELWEAVGNNGDSPTREVSGVICKVVALPLTILLVKAYLAPEASHYGLRDDVQSFDDCIDRFTQNPAGS